MGCPLSKEQASSPATERYCVEEQGVGERTLVTLRGSGMLADGTPYTRKLTIKENVDTEGRTMETSEETLKIGGEEVKVSQERRDDEVVREDVQVGNEEFGQ